MTTSWRPSSCWIKRGNVFNRGEFADLSWESVSSWKLISPRQVACLWRVSAMVPCHSPKSET